MKLDAMKHPREAEVDLTCSQVGNKLEEKQNPVRFCRASRSEQKPDFSYIRLTELISELMDMVDEKKIAPEPLPMSCPFSKGRNR